MSRSGYVPECGDAVWISLNPPAGRGQAERSPALVLSPSAYNGKIGLALLCPILDFLYLSEYTPDKYLIVRSAHV